jgi:hypothetical protein
MEKKLLHIVTAVTLLTIPYINFAQAPTLGTAADYVIFTTAGAVGNTGISQITGNVGTNNQPTFTGFGNVNGVMNNQNGPTLTCSNDVLSAYNQLNAMSPTFTVSTLLGNSATLVPGVYYVPAAATLTDTLFLNALGSASSTFIFQVQGTLSTTTNAKVKLVNGALACNVFWKVEGLVTIAAGTTMRGTILANNAAINMNTGDTLEGRILSTAGAISVDGVLAYTPIGCNSPVLNGPAAPNLASTGCYALFSGSGYVTNTDTTYVTGDVGTNVDLTTGFNPGNVTGMIHPIPDASTAACATDLGSLYAYLNGLATDIKLLFPPQFGNNLVLTPHTYLMSAATVLTDTLYLNAEGNVNAVFVINIDGALSTSTHSKVKLINGAQSKNVFWTVDGAVSINNFSDFKGTIVCNNGAVSINKGVRLDGRAFTTTGDLTTDSIVAIIPVSCAAMNITTNTFTNEAASFYPNPMTFLVTVKVNEASENNSSELKIYDVLGTLVANNTLTKKVTAIETNFPAGVYLYTVISKNGKVQSGKLISQ